MKKDFLPYNSKKGFTTPPSYFEELDDKIMSNIFGEDSKNLLLKSRKIKSGFQVPANYFDSLENQIAEKLDLHQKEVKVVSLTTKERLYHIAGIAACFAAIIGSLLINSRQEPSFETLELSLIEDYIDNNKIDLSTNEISNFMFDEGFEVDDFSNSSIDDEALYDYLSENIDDPTMDLD